MNQQQPYDSSIKGIFKDDPASVIKHFLPGTTLIEILDLEVLRAPMRVDRVYLVQYQGKLHVLHLEFQAREDEDIAHRLLIYHANLWRDYKHPVISIIIYLFRSPVVDSPLREFGGNGELLTFHFSVFTLWTFDAQKFVSKQAISLYALLPAMKNADAALLLQAIDEMVEYYKDDEAKLAQHLLWLNIYLNRTDTMLAQDKQKVRERLDTFEQLLEEDQLIQKFKARAEEKGLQQGLQQGLERGIEQGLQQGLERGKVLEAQRILVTIIRQRFPSLIELAEEKTALPNRLEVLNEAIAVLIAEPDEGMARFVLDSLTTA